MPTPANIHALVALVRQGKKEGLDMLYATYGGALYGIISKITKDKSVAENLLEITFVTIYKRIDQYEVSNNLFTWMLHIMQSVCDEHIKQADVVRIEKESDCYNKDALELIFLGRYTFGEAKKQMDIHIDTVRRAVRKQLKSYSNPIK